MTTADLIAERLETGVAHGRALLAVGATSGEVVEALAPIADSIGDLRERVTA